MLVDLIMCQFILEVVIEEVFELVNRDVAIFLSFRVLLELLSQVLRCTKLVLDVAVDFDHLALDGFELIVWDALGVEHEVVTLRVVAALLASNRGSPRADGVGASGNNSFIRLKVVVEAAQVHRNISVVDLAVLRILELLEVVV